MAVTVLVEAVEAGSAVAVTTLQLGWTGWQVAAMGMVGAGQKLLWAAQRGVVKMPPPEREEAD